MLTTSYVQNQDNLSIGFRIKTEHASQIHLLFSELQRRDLFDCFKVFNITIIYAINQVIYATASS